MPCESRIEDVSKAEFGLKEGAQSTENGFRGHCMSYGERGEGLRGDGEDGDGIGIIFEVFVDLFV